MQNINISHRILTYLAIITTAGFVPSLEDSKITSGSNEYSLLSHPLQLDLSRDAAVCVVHGRSKMLKMEENSIF